MVLQSGRPMAIKPLRSPPLRCRQGNRMTYMFRLPLLAALLVGAVTLFSKSVLAASCCGGGSGASLSVPKYARAVADLSFDAERYDGYWNQDSRHVNDPPGSELRQYRLNLGVGYRFAANWQTSISVPYVWNDNSYSGISSQTDALGDTSVSLTYELLDDTSAWQVHDLAGLTPGISVGTVLLLPTGISPYDDVQSSFDVTGRGFYRLDGTLLIDKTLQPWNAAIAFTYGTHFERSINREYSKYVGLHPYPEYSRQFAGRHTFICLAA
jgi:hypothetical protein